MSTHSKLNSSDPINNLSSIKTPSQLMSKESQKNLINSPENIENNLKLSKIKINSFNDKKSISKFNYLYNKKFFLQLKSCLINSKKDQSQ